LMLIASCGVVLTLHLMISFDFLSLSYDIVLKPFQVELLSVFDFGCRVQAYSVSMMSCSFLMCISFQPSNASNYCS